MNFTINGQLVAVETNETALIMLPDGWACKLVHIDTKPKWRLRSPRWYVRLIKERRGATKIKWGTDYV